MQLHGNGLVAAMCVAQVRNFLPHVVVPAVMAQHLIPLWNLTAMWWSRLRAVQSR
jgi:hypothetical protein